MTALALAPDTRNGYEPAAAAGVDRAIRVSTAVAVLAVAGVAAYVSYWHAYAVVCAHAETGVTARLEPATIDGLVYASSMVNLYAARHLVGSYELLVWIIRTAAAGDLDRGPVADQGGPQAGHNGTNLRLAAAQGPDVGPGNLIGQVAGPTPSSADDPPPVSGMTPAGQVDGPDWNAAGHADQTADQSSGPPGPVTTVSPGGDINAAAVAAYRASLQAGRPLSERKLAGQFGKTSRRWARNRMAEARQSPSPA
jgi:Protein of unknown function (DUF2637)